MRNYQDRNYNRPSFFGGFSFFPQVIKYLLIINVAVYLLQFFFSAYAVHGVPLEYYIRKYFALIPIGYGFKIWQLFTYMFLHGGFEHLFFNMLALWMFGMELEHVFGSKKFFWYYILCGVSGGLANLLLTPIFMDQLAPTVGASGAVFGVLLAFGLLFPDRLIFFYFLIPMKAKYFVIMYLLLEILAVGSMDRVAHLAHLGGAFAGYIFLLAENKQLPFQWLFRKFQRRRNTSEVFYSNPEKYTDQNDTNFYDIKTGKRAERDPFVITQETIDDILDKISKSGYQNLTAEEKRILFEASKKLD